MAWKHHVTVTQQKREDVFPGETVTSTGGVVYFLSALDSSLTISEIHSSFSLSRWFKLICLFKQISANLK